MKCVIVCFLITIFLFACNQRNQVDTIREKADSIRRQKNYLNQVRLFIDVVNGQKRLAISENVENSDLYACIERLKYDSSVFTKTEIAYILEQSHNSPIKKWTNEVIPGAKLINGDTIKLIFTNYTKMWPYFYQKIGTDLTTFSAPIFLRNNQYCIFYSGFHCGDRCGEGELSLYKREGKGWKKVKTYCSWIA